MGDLDPLNRDHNRLVLWAGSFFGAAGRVPRHLLDGVFYDDRVLDPQPVWLAFAAVGGRCL